MKSVIHQNVARATGRRFAKILGCKTCYDARENFAHSRQPLKLVARKKLTPLYRLIFGRRESPRLRLHEQVQRVLCIWPRLSFVLLANSRCSITESGWPIEEQSNGVTGQAVTTECTRASNHAE